MFASCLLMIVSGHRLSQGVGLIDLNSGTFHDHHLFLRSPVTPNGIFSSTACMMDALSVGMRSDPSVTNIDLGVSDTSLLPMVVGRRGTSSGRDSLLGA